MHCYKTNQQMQSEYNTHKRIRACLHTTNSTNMLGLLYTMNSAYVAITVDVNV